MAEIYGTKTNIRGTDEYAFVISDVTQFGARHITIGANLPDGEDRLVVIAPMTDDDDITVLIPDCESFHIEAGSWERAAWQKLSLPAWLNMIAIAHPGYAWAWDRWVAISGKGAACG